MELIVKVTYIYKDGEYQSIYNSTSSSDNWKLGVLEMTNTLGYGIFATTKVEIISAEDEDLAVVASYDYDSNCLEFCHKLWEGTPSTNYNFIYLDDNHSIKELLDLIEKQVMFFMKNTSEKMITVRKSYLALVELAEEGV